MKGIFKLLATFIVTVTCFASCVTSKDTNLLQDIDKPYGVIPPPGEYQIIPGDQLRIVVYVYDDEETKQLFKGYVPSRVSTEEGTRVTIRWNSSLDQEGAGSTEPITVYADGTIKFPYLGRIHVQGLTLLEARQLISTRLKEISSNASANVTLFNNYFSILGESGARRIEMSKTSLTIYQALATSGNISNYSVRDKVNIIRQTKDGTVVKTFDLRSKDIINTEFYYIQPNDVLYFPQMKGKFFGATTSFFGVFGLITSFAGIITMAIRLF